MGRGRKRYTHDSEQIGVLSLHPRRNARILVPRTVLGVDHGHDRVERERAGRRALEFAGREGEGAGNAEPLLIALVRVSA